MSNRITVDNRRFAWWTITAATAALMFVALLVTVAPAVAQGPSPAGYYYTIQEGDSWTSVAKQTGVSVEALKAANPDAVNTNDWLLSGDKLLIPTVAQAETRTHTVQSGESWNSIADKYNIPVALLMAANPNAVRPRHVLFRGETLVIPPAESAVATAPVTGPITVTVEATVEPTLAPTEEPTATLETEATPALGPTPRPRSIVVPAGATPTPTAPTAMPTPETVTVTETATLTETDQVTATIPITSVATPAPGDAAAADCPTKFTEYADALLAAANSDPGGAETLSAYLAACQADVADGLVATDLTGDGVDDLVVVYLNPNQQSSFVEGDLVILVAGLDGYALAYRARAAGEVRLLATEDVNLDGQMDVVWVDTTCGASTCFDTVNVRSWDGRAWIDWTDGTITMAYAEITLDELAEAGQGNEIQLTGGIYGSVGAGPQRSRTEVWGSLAGAPYSLIEKTYSESECLYHTVLDANRSLLDAPTAGFDAPKALYEKALTDTRLIKCWVRDNELAELRSFSLFRLALIDAYLGDTQAANDRIAQLGVDFPGSTYEQVGQVWLKAYAPNQDVAAGCAAVTAFADKNPEAWEMLADYGYTNPTFEAIDICPVLELEAPGSGGADTGAAGANPSEPVSQTASAPALAVLPLCPDDLAGYTDVLPAVLAAAEDQAGIEAWLRQCQALDADHGALVLADINSDDVQDAVVFPTLITDLGLGPQGAQGAVLIYHGAPDGSYFLAAHPEVYGQPTPLAVEDLNADGRTDLAWTVTGCSTFCVLEVQAVTWDADSGAYASIIAPGAAIAEGKARFEPVPVGDPGSGRQLVLTGGVSGAPEGGLAVPHTEIWQSVDAAPFTRLRWDYDRRAEQNDCLGLRLVEADMALQAADIRGFTPAHDLYAAALSDDLAACSIFDLPADKELALLHGLARFRLIQTLALAEDLNGAEAALAEMRAALPDSLYTQAAGQWLDAITASFAPAAACSAVQSIFVDNSELWQITDNFGYNHPALAAEQICYIP